MAAPFSEKSQYRAAEVSNDNHDALPGPAIPLQPLASGSNHSPPAVPPVYHQANAQRSVDEITLFGPGPPPSRRIQAEFFPAGTDEARFTSERQRKRNMFCMISSFFFGFLVFVGVITGIVLAIISTSNGGNVNAAVLASAAGDSAASTSSSLFSISTTTVSPTPTTSPYSVSTLFIITTSSTPQAVTVTVTTTTTSSSSSTPVTTQTEFYLSVSVVTVGGGAGGGAPINGGNGNNNGNDNNNQPALETIGPYPVVPYHGSVVVQTPQGQSVVAISDTKLAPTTTVVIVTIGSPPASDPSCASWMFPYLDC